MKKLSLLLFMMIGITALAQTDEEQELMKDAAEAKSELIVSYEKLVPFFDDSAGYVIFPNVGKGGLIIGGASGNGIVYENGAAVGKAGLKKLSVGLQAGGQAIMEVIFFEDEENLKNFKEGNFEFAAGVSAVVLKSGKAVNAKYKDGVAVFAKPKAGIMADASVGGQKFSYDAFED